MNNYKFKIKDRDYTVEIVSIENTVAKVYVNGEIYQVEVEQQLRTTKTPTLTRKLAVPSTESTPSIAKTAGPAVPKPAGIIASPLPGKVLDIFVKQGEKVSIGQTIVCLEAMKMENNINSDREGIVIAIHAMKGDTVLEGDPLIELG
ncbi:MAG: biotin/lipoyl-binding protein [Ferruginibacter sp.]|nr:biotin/lipoyl-binding protein [Chitinophagaceae bacterium]